MQAIAELPSHTSHKVLVTFSGLLLVMLLGALDSTIVTTALPTIVNELGDMAHLSWIVTAYLLAQIIVTPIYGKLGDLYGRKHVLQFAVVVFLIGSALCGLSRSMTQLILFRAIQGLGGGGLMLTTQALVGDIIPPIQRGRYQGIFGAVLGVGSVAGPILGGYFSSNLTWRWIFYINVPLGILALVVLTATLLRTQDCYQRSAIDYLGAILLVASLAALLGSITHLPLFLQTVKAMSPTESGLRTIPFMGGTLITSTLAGQIASRTGRYKDFSDYRHSDGDAGVVSDLENDRRDDEPQDCRVNAAARTWDRLLYADAGYRGAERGRVSRSWCCNIERDFVSPNRRIARYCAARSGALNAAR